MRKYTLLVLALVCALISGCDFIRASLGKPTSKDIEAARTAKFEREKAVADSLETVRIEAERAAAEQAAAEASAKERYYVVVGAFKDSSNADSLASKLSGQGYAITRFEFKNGLKVVAVAGEDKMEDENLAKYNPWLYDKERYLHIIDSI